VWGAVRRSRARRVAAVAAVTTRAPTVSAVSAFSRFGQIEAPPQFRCAERSAGGGGIGARSAVPWGAVRRSRARRVAALLMRQLSVNANCQLTHFRDLAKSRPRPKSAVPGGGGIGARSAVPWGAVGRGRGTVVETLNILSRAARRSLTVWGPWPQGGAN
jgi:hypothetical protein